jgi:hypothetical protein
MPNISKWTKVAIAIQSALGAAKTITAITKANPGVVTSTAHGLLNGAFVLLEVAGMAQVNDRVFRIAAVAVNTFELEGQDTTSYDTFVSGTAKEITFGTSVATATGVTASGGEFEFEDTTTIHDTVRSQIPTLASAPLMTFENIWDVADLALIALKAASDAATKRAVRMTFANAQKLVFNSYIGATLLPGGTAPGKVTTQVVMTMAAQHTVYAT